MLEWLVFPLTVMIVIGLMSIGVMLDSMYERPQYTIRRQLPVVRAPRAVPAAAVPAAPAVVAVKADRIVEERVDDVELEHIINKTLVFTTKNRYGYVRLLADSLEYIKAYEHAHIHVFDDGSTDFSIQDLNDWFPYAQVHESDHRHPDMTIRHSFEWFIDESDDNILITIDSDTLLHPNWNAFIDTHITTSGVLSLYHSAATYHKSVNCNGVTCEKKSTGSMGMVMTRRIVKDMLLNMHSAKHKTAAFDWGFVNYFEMKGIKIIVPKKSLALHYGMYGAHGSGNHVEVANTFDFTPFPEDITTKANQFLKNKKPARPALNVLNKHNHGP
tara:strand:- start:592 stop:1578 length:987 start_codon:yes stop_codon:yes gene_type:complete